jgi:hypothetical protein
MKWTVIWQPVPLEFLADCWTSSPDRAAVSAASDRIDWLLKHDPLNSGEERGDGSRILIELPLAVLFSVSEGDRMVSVYDAWRCSNPRLGN